MSSHRRAQALVVACALLAYATVLCGTFIYDDVHTARDNLAIRSLANIPRFFVDVNAFSSIECRMYRPIVLVSYALDWAIGQGAALPFKLTNLALHTGVALALQHLIVRLGGMPRAATLAACLFAVHPLASEAVNTISGRSELGVTLGLLLGLVAHLRAREGARYTLLTVACVLLACGCKEIGVVLPALLLVLDPPGRGAWRAWFLRHLPPALAVLGYLALRAALLGHATTPLPRWSGGTDVFEGYGRDLQAQLCTMAVLLPRALAQCVAPLGLSLDPTVRFERSPVAATVVAGALFVATVTYLGLRGARHDRLRRVGVAFAWLTALPWIVVTLNLPYLEHRMYAPLTGLAAVLAAVASRRAQRSAAEGPHPLGRSLAAGAVVAVFAGMASARSLEYRDPTAMWHGLVQAQPGSVRGLCGLAQCYIERGDVAAALPLVERAVGLRPTHVAALRNLAEINMKLVPAPGNAMAALVAADVVVQSAPLNPFARVQRSRALALAAEATGFVAWYDDAEAEALHCLTVAEPKSLVYRTAAAARTRQGDHERALALLDMSLAAGLVNAQVLLDRAACLRQLGRSPEASAVLRQAQRDYPLDPAVLDAIGLFAAQPPGAGR